MLPTSLTSRADLALAEKKWTDAITFAERAIAALEVAGGAQNPELWRPLAKLARAHSELKQPALAKKAIERALAIIDAAKIDEPDALALRTIAP